MGKYAVRYYPPSGYFYGGRVHTEHNDIYKYIIVETSNNNKLFFDSLVPLNKAQGDIIKYFKTREEMLGFCLLLR